MSIISDVERQVEARLAELEPLVEEYRQLEEVLRTFKHARSSTSPTAKPAKKTSRRRPRGSVNKEGSSTYSRGRRAAEAIELITTNPGIRVTDLADKMGIGPTYLYRVLPALERDGKLKKSGKGYELA